MGKPLHENNLFAPRFILGWMFFTASAGFVNAAALMAGDNVVSHVTGSITTFATEPGVALRIGLVVTAFLMGGIMSGLAHQKLEASKAYVLPPIVAAVFLVAMAAFGRLGFFGEFGGDNDVKGHAFPMLTMLAFAMGAINASVGIATANRIRVTHMTGPLTDLAGHIVRGESKWVALRVGSVIAFVAGAAFAAKLGSKIEFEMFAVGACFLLLAVTLTGAPAEDHEKEPAKKAIKVGPTHELGEGPLSLATASVTLPHPGGVFHREAEVAPKSVREAH